MIRDTNADCKILNISTTGAITKINCAVFSIKPTTPAQAFQFYFKDFSTGELTLLTNRVYWIDRINAYSTSAVNVNILNYKEISLDVDITNSANSVIVDKHWVRKGYLQLINTNNASMTPAWTSAALTLISENFEIPELKYAAIVCKTDSSDTNKVFITVKFKLLFTSSQTLKYNFNNLVAVVKLKNISEQKELETVTLDGQNITVENIATFVRSYNINTPFVIEICITNKQGTPYFAYKKRYTTKKTTGKTYIRTLSGIKTAIGWYKQSEIYDDKDKARWLLTNY